MIKANELRLGNWVSNGGNIRVEHYMLCDSYIDYYAIPITPKILEKAGWVWNEDCKSFEKYPNGDARMHLAKSEVNGMYTMFNYVLKAKIADMIFYLHQLQNLYFALTGEELEIEL